MKIFTETKQHRFEFESRVNDNGAVISKNGQPLEYELTALGDGRYSLLLNNQSFLVHLQKDYDSYHVRLAGDHFMVKVEDEKMRRVRELVKLSHSAAHEQVIKAPIPGLVVKVLVQPNDEVKHGDNLLALEAMKMENLIKAPCDCKVLEVKVKERETVQQNQELIRLITE